VHYAERGMVSHLMDEDTLSETDPQVPSHQLPWVQVDPYTE
jgi:hypothetical protein